MDEVEGDDDVRIIDAQSANKPMNAGESRQSETRTRSMRKSVAVTGLTAD